ncbi:MAG: cache domain-containing protein [Chloroflexi bacterium]|nr:cache domain-containing protein [Chloroflexota bacterium]
MVVERAHEVRSMIVPSEKKDGRAVFTLASLLSKSFGGGLVVHSVLLSAALVIGTASAVAVVTVLQVRHVIEQRTDSRLAEGAEQFRASLDRIREDLLAVGTWLTSDRELIAAAGDGRRELIAERLMMAVRLQAVDDALVADAQGRVVVRSHADNQSETNDALSRTAGFLSALAGRPAYGIVRAGEGLFLQVMYFPFPSPTDRQPIGVVRVASFLDQRQLDRFRSRTGLEASLLSDSRAVATTLRGPDGEPLEEIRSAQTIYKEVTGTGREVLVVDDLPVGQFRTLYAPLVGSDRVPVGVFAVGLPTKTMMRELADALLPTSLVALLIIALGAALAFLLARRVREPIGLLAEAAARLSDGDLWTPIPRVEQAELAPLAEQLELARRSVQSNLEATARREAHERAVFAALSEPVLTASESGDLTGFNPAAIALFGSATCVRGRRVQELLPFVTTPPSSKGEETIWQGCVVNAGGSNLEVEAARAELVEPQRRSSFIYVVRDVSRYAELNRLREELLHNVSHELRAPLAVLDNALQILASDYAELSANEFDQLMGSARRTVQRLRNLLDGLLSIGAIKSGRFVVHTEPVQLSVIIDEAMEGVEARMEAHRQGVELHVPRLLPTVLADRRLACQVLENLLSNASKYGPDGEAIRVEAAAAGDEVRVTVGDRGPGIPPERRARLFERFYRLDPDRREPGVGLGLAIARDIVEAHGGSIGMDSEVGVGTRVWFTLPVAGRSAGASSSRR